ncbi:trehalose-phosphatase [Methylobrevis pamukkalensis]|uniref:Trehalose 6-phosphate phosphatase n=1 Tax=Methylobrevis pamukkalensis TaxID=1439726 RepID=A0A1E3H3Q7_9HYPH|nr:trehalose-phosphatase [Methylobrevis pamukkalensis]ODN70785.1 Trehalose-6-phosphate phosphatase [Methylobrevis pamukkalensis]
MSYPRLPARPALFLDFDGTLVDLAPTPDAVVVPSGLAHLLQRLADRLDGALAVVSGRPVAEIDAFLAPTELRAGGLHGLEWRERPGVAVMQAPAPISLDVFRARLATSDLLRDGLLVEDKKVAIAVHYRARPDLGSLVRETITGWLEGVDDLAVLDGKMVVEVKPRAVSKGTVVQRFLAMPAFEGRVPVFVGDDVTDEDGMRAAARAGGFGVKVGEGPSGASYRLADVPAVRTWLASLE